VISATLFCINLTHTTHQSFGESRLTNFIPSTREFQRLALHRNLNLQRLVHDCMDELVSMVLVNVMANCFSRNAGGTETSPTSGGTCGPHQKLIVEPIAVRQNGQHQLSPIDSAPSSTEFRFSGSWPILRRKHPLVVARTSLSMSTNWSLNGSMLVLTGLDFAPLDSVLNLWCSCRLLTRCWWRSSASQNACTHARLRWNRRRWDEWSATTWNSCWASRWRPLQIRPSSRNPRLLFQTNPCCL